MFAFTRSISALNSSVGFSVGMGLIKAKNAFKKKLSQEHSPADYKSFGVKQWDRIAAKSRVLLVLADIDFSDIVSIQDTVDSPVKLNGALVRMFGFPSSSDENLHLSVKVKDIGILILRIWRS